MREGAQFGYWQAALWMVAPALALILCAQAISIIEPGIFDDLVSLGIVSAAIYVGFAALLVGTHATGTSVLPAIGVRPTHPALIPLALVLGVVAQVPADSLLGLSELVFQPTEEELLRRALLFRTETPLQAVMMVLVVACLVPVAEEVFFRGVLFGTLRRFGKPGVGAAIVTGLGFTFSHFDIAQWLPILFMAGLLGLVRVVSGSLLPCLALHVGFNALTIVGVVTGLIPAYGDVQVPVFFAVAGWLFTGALLMTVAWLSTGSAEAAESRKRETDDG